MDDLTGEDAQTYSTALYVFQSTEPWNLDGCELHIVGLVRCDIDKPACKDLRIPWKYSTMGMDDMDNF